MTVVACFQYQGQPLLIGDLLLTQWFESPPTSSQFSIPTVTDVNDVIPYEWGMLVTGLQQKIVVLDDTFAIAWAGSMIAARFAIREINELMAKGPFRIEQLRELLSRIELGNQELTLTGLLVEKAASDSHAVTRFGWDLEAGWSKPCTRVIGFDPIYVGGSGENDLLKKMNAFSASVNRADDSMGVATVISAAVSLTNLLSGEQSRTSEGIAARYGGGFEVATFANGRISKVGGVTHFFMDVMRTQNESTKLRLRRAITYNYQGDVLLVGTVELEMDLEWVRVNEQIELAMDSEAAGSPAIYVIAPVHRSLSGSERQEFTTNPPNCSFSSRYTALYVHLPQRNGLVRSIVHYAPINTPVFGLILDGRNADLQIAHSFFDKIDACLSEAGIP